MLDSQQNENGAADTAPASATTRIVRLDARSGKNMRTELTKLLKGERFKGSKQQLSEALDISPNATANLLNGNSNGSLATADKVAKLAGIKLESIVGSALAAEQLATPTFAPKPPTKATKPSPAKPKARPAAPKPAAVAEPAIALPARQVPLAVSEVPDGLTSAQLASVRAGRAGVELLNLLADEYEGARRSNYRMMTHIVAGVLKGGAR